MPLISHRYKKEYTVLEKTLKVVVSVFVEKEGDSETIVKRYGTNYAKIVSTCLFPTNPTSSLIYQREKLSERVNAFFNGRKPKYYIDELMSTFAHYHIARYIDKEMLDEIVVGINKNTNARGVVYTINDEKVTVGLTEDVKELSIDDDPRYDIDEDFKSRIESSNDPETEEKPTGAGNGQNGGRKSIWWLLAALLLVALLCSMVEIIMSHRSHQNNENGDTISQTDSVNLSPDVEGKGKDVKGGEVDNMGNNKSKNEKGNTSPNPIEERKNVQDSVKNNDDKRSQNPIKESDPKGGKPNPVEVDNQIGTIEFPYGLYYGEYKNIDGRRYPYGAGVMKYNQRTALRSTVTGWSYRYVKAGYELSGIWEGEKVRCGTLFEVSAGRTVLDSVPCK